MIGRLIEISHGLCDIDIAVTLLHAFTVEAFHHFRMISIVLWYFIHRLIKDALGITRFHHHVFKYHRVWFHPDNQAFILSLRHFEVLSLITHMRQNNHLGLIHRLDSEETVLVCHRGNALTRHMNVHIRQLTATHISDHTTHSMLHFSTLHLLP